MKPVRGLVGAVSIPQRLMKTGRGFSSTVGFPPNLGALRTGTRVSEAVLWQNLNQCYDKGRFKDLFTGATSSSTLTVYCDIISRHTHKQLSCTKPLPQGILLQ